MGLLARIFGLGETVRTPDRRGVSVLVGSDAGVYLTEDVLMGENTAMAAASLIARSTAMLPADVLVAKSSDPRDGNVELRDHQVARLMAREASPDMTAMAFREGMQLTACLRGNAYAEIERDAVGRPYALWPIHTDRVEVIRDEQGRVAYLVQNGGRGASIILAQDMLHLMGPSIDGGLTGLSPLSYARHTIGLAVAQERFAASFIRNQAAPSGVIKLKHTLNSPEAMDRMREEVEKRLTGPRRAGRVAILDNEADWQQVGLTLVDAEFLAQRRYSAEQVAAIFGVPPQLLGDSTRQTFANFAEAGLNFLAYGLQPWVTRWEQEVNRKLLTEDTRLRKRPFLRINTSAVVRSDIEKRTAAYALGRQWGWLSVNDVRRLEDMEPIGAEGDVYITPGPVPAAPGRGTR